MENNKRLFRKLGVYFKDNIKLSHVMRYNVLIVTNDDRVYQIDEYVKETYSSIAYTSDESEIKSLIEKSTFEELCYKGVIEFNSSYAHTIARTFDEKFYVWGENMYEVIGN
jgi:predicted transcriptional regulator